MRSAGILMPVSALPSPSGIGTMGKGARAFVDFLARSGQKWWQILPVGPTSYGDSPYQSFSGFAGNPYFIDPEELEERGLLAREEWAGLDFGDHPGRVDYGKLYRNRFGMLKKACGRFDFGDWDYQGFCYRCGWWLDDYALFMAVKAAHGMVSLSEWEDCFRLREPAALEEFRKGHAGEIDFWKFVQYQFWRQWRDLKGYASAAGVGILGDLPIYVSADSAEVWAQPELFLLDGQLRPLEVAGCPPDAFAEGGQLWGNPLYRWERHRETGFGWWVSRMRAAAQAYDAVRIDHFRGFESFYAIPAGNKDARNGVWRKGPGMELISELGRQLPGLRIVAEDLGFLTPEVRQLLADSGFPGMKVLQFAFDSSGGSDYLPHRYERNSVVYTGTHDNTTAAGWEEEAPAADVAFAREYLGVGEAESLPEAMIRAALGSVCDLAVIPLQDYLGLGAGARCNTPSTLGGNWVWRAEESALTEELAERIRRLTWIYGRLT